MIERSGIRCLPGAAPVAGALPPAHFSRLITSSVSTSLEAPAVALGGVVGKVGESAELDLRRHHQPAGLVCTSSRPDRAGRGTPAPPPEILGGVTCVRGADHLGEPGRSPAGRSVWSSRPSTFCSSSTKFSEALFSTTTLIGSFPDGRQQVAEQHGQPPSPEIESPGARGRPLFSPSAWAWRWPWCRGPGW